MKKIYRVKVWRYLYTTDERINFFFDHISDAYQQYLCEQSLMSNEYAFIEKDDALERLKGETLSFENSMKGEVDNLDNLFRFKVTIGIKYSEADYRRAELFHLRFDRMVYIGNNAAPTEMWFSPCCSQHKKTTHWAVYYAKQHKDLCMLKGEVRKIRNGSSTDVGWMVITKELHDALLQNGCSSDDFRPVWDMKYQEIIAYELSPAASYPPIAMYNTWTITSACQNCGASTYKRDSIAERTAVYMPRFMMNDAKPIARTTETFAAFAAPLVIVNKSTYDIMRQYCEKRHFEPIMEA